MAKTILIDFGKRVKQLRVKKGLTQIQLANKGDFDRKLGQKV
jgi:transcriptional regulator with XRE-family HTH domain